jgi:hypothetical protein
VGAGTDALRWPSTTGIIRHFGLTKGYGPPNEELMKRGRLVHAACHLIAAEDSDPEWEARHPECMPYVDAYRKFFREHEFLLLEAEREYRSEVLRFVSHPDQLGVLDGKRPALIEIKSGGLPKWVQLQTAGQVLAIGIPTIHRFALQLKVDGGYTLVAHEDWRDLDRFRSMIDTYWTQREFTPFEGAIPS